MSFTTSSFSILTASSALLGAHIGSNQPLFQPNWTQNTLFFDEGPNQWKSKTTVTSSLSGSLSNLSSSYPYLQGVELTMQSQYDAGIVKIWSGEAGHRMAICNYGQDKNFFPDPGFADMDLFNPQTFLEAQEFASPLYYNIITFPIVTGDNDQLENYNFNGVIEPLTIRPVVAFFSTDVPFEAHAVKGQFGNGNANQINGSDSVLTVYDFEPTQQIVGFLDMVDIINSGTEISGTWSSGSWSGRVPYSGSFIGSGIFTPVYVPTGTPLNGFFRYEFTTVLPFVDARLVRNVSDPLSGEPANADNDWQITAAMSLMTGSTDNYVRYNQVSMPCGWYYDNNAEVGTDSLPFGGMTY